MHARSPSRCGAAKLYAYVPKLVLEFVMTNWGKQAFIILGNCTIFAANANFMQGVDGECFFLERVLEWSHSRSGLTFDAWSCLRETSIFAGSR